MAQGQNPIVKNAPAKPIVTNTIQNPSELAKQKEEEAKQASELAAKEEADETATKSNDTSGDAQGGEENNTGVNTATVNALSGTPNVTATQTSPEQKNEAPKNTGSTFNKANAPKGKSINTKKSVHDGMNEKAKAQLQLKEAVEECTIILENKENLEKFLSQDQFKLSFMSLTGSFNIRIDGKDVRIDRKNPEVVTEDKDIALTLLKTKRFKPL